LNQENRVYKFLMENARVLIGRLERSAVGSIWIEKNPDIMKTQNILIPVNLAKCPLEIFSLIKSFDSDSTVTMLHVINLNLFAPPARLIDEVCREAERRLQAAERKFLNREVNSRVCVRAGDLSEEILAEAKRIESDLIVLTSRNKPPWKRFLNRFGSPLTKVVQEAPCAVGVVPVKTAFDCTQDLRNAIEVVAFCEIVLQLNEHPIEPPTPFLFSEKMLSIVPSE
jgi:nucleotide-binding universal stress UspA family protein